jgi:hypothetical protein
MRPLRYSINVTFDGCCGIAQCSQMKTCIVTRSRTSLRPMRSCLAE